MLPTSWMCSACILILKRFRSRLVPTQQICHAKTPETKSLTTHPERHQTAGPPPWRLRTAMDAALLPADPARPATKDENLRFKTSKNSTIFHELQQRCWNMLKIVETTYVPLLYEPTGSAGAPQPSSLLALAKLQHCSEHSLSPVPSVTKGSWYPLYQSALAILSCSKTK